MLKVLLLANRDFVLYNFRNELIERLIRDGYEVYIGLPYGPKVDLMVKEGAQFKAIQIEGRGTNPIKDLQLVADLKKLIRQVHPDIVLTYTTKMDIYAGIVCSKLHIPYLVNISGLGTAVEQQNALQKLMLALYRRAVRDAACVFFQNQQNEQFFKENHILVKKSRLIPGSGVNLSKWHSMEYPSQEHGLQFLFVARIIKEKGIEEYLAVAKAMKEKHPDVVFHVCGPCDGDYQAILEDYQERGIIQYHGMVQDIGVYLKDVHCLIHPSYYPEGISNVLLESEASCRPVITTDRPGCRETVEDGITGFLIPEKDRDALIRKVDQFIQLPWEKKQQMGLVARAKVEKEFNRQIVVDAYCNEINNSLRPNK